MNHHGSHRSSLYLVWDYTTRPLALRIVYLPRARARLPLRDTSKKALLVASADSTNHDVYYRHLPRQATRPLEEASAQADARPTAIRRDFHLGQLSGPASFTKNAFVDT
jgi:hypothetical protein